MADSINFSTQLVEYYTVHVYKDFKSFSCTGGLEIQSPKANWTLCTCTEVQCMYSQATVPINDFNEN